MTQKERENFYRNSTAIVDHENEVLTLLLENELSQKNWSVTDFLERKQHDIYHLFENITPCCQCVNGKLPSKTPRNRVLYLEQINLLINQNGKTLPCHGLVRPCTQPFCCRPAMTTTTLNDMDITLKRCLLVNFASNCQRGSPVRQAVDNLVQYRNKLYGHAKEAAMTDNDFQKNFADVEREIIVIAQFCSAEIKMRQKLQDTKIRPLDEAICRQFQSHLLSEIAQNSETQEELLDLKAEIEKNNQNIQNQLADINVNVVDTFSVLNEMQREQDTSVEILYGTIKDSEDHIRADIETSKQHIATKIDCLEHQISFNHEELRHQVERTESNIKTSIIENEVRREERQRFYFDEVITEMQMKTIADQGKKNIIAQTKCRMKHHTENGIYVPTKAVKEGLLVLENEGILLLVSKGGAGKTTMCLQLASIYQEKGYEPLFFIDQEIKQYRNCINPHEKCIVIIDDFFGRTNVQFDDNIHKNLLDLLLYFKGLKLVFTCRQNPILSSGIFANHCIFKENMVLDLDTKWQLSSEEKRDILLKYMYTHKVYSCSCQPELLSKIAKHNFCNVYHCKEQVILFPDQSAQICKETIYKIIESDPYIGFPEACRQFCSDRNITLLGIEYFQRTNQSQVDKIKKILLQGFKDTLSKYKYCILVYIALRGPLKTEINPINIDTLFKTLFNVVFEDKNIPLKKTFLETAFQEMEGTMIEKYYDINDKTEVWKFKHETICEAVLISFGNECPEIFLKFASLHFILKIVKPSSSKCAKSDQSVKIYISDEALIKKFKTVLVQDRNITKHFSLNRDIYYADYTSSAKKIGKYIRKYSLVNRNDLFVKRFFELIPLNNFQMYEIWDLLDGLTHNGKDKLIDNYHPDFCNTSNINLNVTWALCRPKSLSLNSGEFYCVHDKILLMYLLKIMESLDDENYNTIFDIGRFSLTVGMQEGNHRFFNIINNSKIP